MAKSTYYAVMKSINKGDKYSELKEAIKRICIDNKGRYGYRRVTLTLKSEGFKVNHKVVMRLMKQTGLTCKVRLKKYKSYKGERGKAAPNILQRNFKADKPNEKWATDITEFALFGKKLYLSPIIDLYNGEIISYKVSDRPVLKQVTDMVKQAIKQTGKIDCLLLHSDQGWQYQHEIYRKLLKENGIIQSMSRKGNCLDNAVMENFFGLLKSELFYFEKFESIEDFREKLDEYIDYYNNRRIKVKLKGLSPVEYRTKSLRTA